MNTLKDVLKKLTTSASSFRPKDVANIIKNRKKPGRPMKFPHTFTAKFVQFPFKFYFKNNWIWGYYPYGILVSMPIFWYISTLANTPENKRIWAEKRQREFEEHSH